MSGNPFDDFASEIRSAIPAPANMAHGVPESAPSAATAAAKPSVMNTFAAPAPAGYPGPTYMMPPPAVGYPPAGIPPMQQQPMQPMGFHVMPPSGGIPPAPPQGMMGVPPPMPQQQPMGFPPMMQPAAGMPPAPQGMANLYPPSPWGGAPAPSSMPPPPTMAPPPPVLPPTNANALVPSAVPSNPYASMLGSTAPPPTYGSGMMPPAPYGVPPPSQPVTQQPPAAPHGYSTHPIPPSSAPPAPAGSAAFDPLSTHDPWGPGPSISSNSVVGHYSGGVSDDPFGVFGGKAVPPPAVAPPMAPPPQPTFQAPVAPPMIDDDDGPAGYTHAPPSMTQNQILSAADDFWGDMGFSPAPTTHSTSTSQFSGDIGSNAAATTSSSSNHKSGELPPGGEWYDARIFTPTLGVMFFKPKELVDSLFLQTDPALVEALEERPVVAFIVEGSSARSAGVELGHVLLKVNGIDVKNPKEASRLIKEGPRPLPLLFYVPDTTVVVAEGEHMVKYDTRDTGAPNSAKDWKPKYVVIGGIIAQPWMMNMYRSKSEYDIAVIETQARRPVSVKVKQFSLQGARILNDWQGPQVVKYKNKLHPWKYIVVMPVGRNPIKISAENLTQLKPVHEGIRRVLASQQRNLPGGGAGGMTRVDPYGRPYPEEDSNPPNYYNTQSQMMQSSQQQQQYSNYPSAQPYQYPNEGNVSGGGDQPSGISGGTSSVRRRQE